MRLLLLTIYVLIGANANAQETKTSIGFALSPNYSSVRYVDNGAFSQSDIELIELRTTGAPGLSGNVFFQYELMDKLFITWGLGIQNYRYSTTYYSQSQIEYPELSVKTTYSQFYLQLSTSVKYQIYKTLYVRAGIGADVLAEPRVEITQSCPTCQYYYKGDDHSSNFKEAMLPISLGVGYELKLSDRLNLMSELFGTMVMTDAKYSISSLNSLPQRPLQVGFSLGIIRSF